MSTAEAVAALAADPVYRVLKASGEHRKKDAAKHRAKFLQNFVHSLPEAKARTAPAPAAAPAAPSVDGGPTDLAGAMASLDAFHRANGLPPAAARGPKAPAVHVPAAATAGPPPSFEAQMQAGADAARQLLHPEAVPVAQQAAMAERKRADRRQEVDRRAIAARAERQAGAETARKLLGR